MTEKMTAQTAAKTTERIELFAAAPGLMQEWQRSMYALHQAAALEPKLTALVQIRASQINGCANCINLHATGAREQGETAQRIDLLPAWREAPCYSVRERAALSWTEALTRLCDGESLESARTVLQTHFSMQEQAKLTVLINVINGWNRLAVGFGLWADPAAVKTATALLAGAVEEVA